MKKMMCYLTIIIITIFTDHATWADTSGEVTTNPYFNWGDQAVGNGGYGDLAISGNYNLTGEISEGYAEVNGYVYGETSIGTAVNEDGFLSNSSFGFAEMSGTSQALSGEGTLNLNITGNLGNWSQIGSDTNNFSAAYHETNLSASSQETQGTTLTGDARLSGYAYSSERDGIEVGGFHSEFTGSISGMATVNGGVETSSTKSAGGINSSSMTSTVTGLEIMNGQYAEGFGESQSFAEYGESGAFGSAMAHSYTIIGDIPPATP